MNNVFLQDYKLTLGVDFFQKKYVFAQQKQQYQLWYQFWDIAGQDYNTNLVHSFYANSSACVIVCDVSVQSFQNGLQLWLNEVRAKVLSQQRVPTVLVCNKMDLQDVRRLFDGKMQSILGKLGFDAVLPASAMTGEGADELLSVLSGLIVKYQGANGAV